MEEAKRCIYSSGHGHIIARAFVSFKDVVLRARGIVRIRIHRILGFSG